MLFLVLQTGEDNQVKQAMQMHSFLKEDSLP